MKILAMESSGDKTSVSVMLDEEINSFTLSHARKDRPNWDMFLDNIGHKKIFNLSEKKLKLRGYIGFSLFGKTTIWTKSNLIN